jgi:hypothetical protein
VTRRYRWISNLLRACPYLGVFFALADVREKLETWLQDYNQVWPHSALADLAVEKLLVRCFWQQSDSSTKRSIARATTSEEAPSRPPRRKLSQIL